MVVCTPGHCQYHAGREGRSCGVVHQPTVHEAPQRDEDVNGKMKSEQTWKSDVNCQRCPKVETCLFNVRQ